jgi:hypothetical protein
MQKYFAMKWRILHLNPGANVVRFAPLFKCKRLPSVRANDVRRLQQRWISRKT